MLYELLHIISLQILSCIGNQTFLVSAKVANITYLAYDITHPLYSSPLFIQLSGTSTQT